MARAIVDPDELRLFANHLDRLVEALRGEKLQVNDTLRSLEAIWKDAKYRQFKLNYEEISQGMDEFIKSAVAYASYLRKKAARADKYLGR